MRDHLKAKKMDFSKFDFLSNYFLILLFYVGVGLFLGINSITNAILLGSWQMFFNALPLFLPPMLVFGITMYVLNRFIRTALLHKFLEQIEQRPRLLFYQRISRATLMASTRLYYVPSFTLFFFFPTYKTLPPDIKSIALGLFSLSATLVLVLFLFGFSMFLRFDNKRTALYGLEYLAKTPNQDLRTFSSVRAMEFLFKDIVVNLHQLYLINWKFAQQINLWPEFNVIFLGLLCGNEKENGDTKTFLKKLIENLKSAEDPESYRRVADSLNEFKTEMKSLSELEDETMLKGSSAIRKPFQERIEGYAPWIAILVTILGIGVSILLRLLG